MCVSCEKIQELYWLEHWHFLDSFISYWSTHSFVTHTTITLRINNSQTARFRRSRAAFPLPPPYPARTTQLQLTNPRSSDGGGWFPLDRCSRKRNSPANIFDTDLNQCAKQSFVYRRLQKRRSRIHLRRMWISVLHSWSTVDSSVLSRVQKNQNFLFGFS